jgi:uncharacterized protein (DUF2384 family)
MALAKYARENLKHARTFLLSEQPSPGGASPIDLTWTELGAREIVDFLLRMEHSLPG